jgi:uncharacterized membrane protein
MAGRAAVTDAARGRAGATRVAAIDVLRGLAIVAMIAYHFSFDLRYFGVTHADLEHTPFWLVARASIVTAFLTLVGVSLVLASANRNRTAFGHHVRRVARIAGCAILVSAASYAMFPRTFIYFGVLHAIAVISILAWPLRERPVAALVSGIAIVVAGLALADAHFDSPLLSWIGFMTHKPTTEDYVPLFPWAGVVLIGIGIGHWLRRRAFAPIVPLARAPAWIAFLGRHSLAVYMIHQPILFGALWVLVAPH